MLSCRLCSRFEPFARLLGKIQRARVESQRIGDVSVNAVRTANGETPATRISTTFLQWIEKWIEKPTSALESSSFSRQSPPQTACPPPHQVIPLRRRDSEELIHTTRLAHEAETFYAQR